MARASALQAEGRRFESVYLHKEGESKVRLALFVFVLLIESGSKYIQFSKRKKAHIGAGIIGL